MTPRYLASPAEMVELDRRTIAAGTTGAELMNRAGGAIATVILDEFRGWDLHTHPIVILCGPGNNGGDGIVIARELLRFNLSPTVVIARAGRYSDDLRSQLHSLTVASGEVRAFGESSCAGDELALESITEAELRALVAKSPVVVDALLGTGQTSAPRGAVGALIAITSGHPCVVSVDIPSGINGATGEVYEPSVAARRTVAIECVKRGCMQYPARTRCGDISVVSIGIAIDPHPRYRVLDRTSAPRLIRRTPDTHKGESGRVCVIGGSLAMPGAPMLAALGALRCGAGLVFSAVPLSEPTFSPHRPLEIIGVPAPLEEGGGFGSRSLPIFSERVAQVDAVVLGPGLGRSAGVIALVTSLVDQIAATDLPAVLDADALFALTKRSTAPKLTRAILTPHPGEAAMLLGCSTAEVQRDRFTAAEALHTRYGATIVLKGAATIVVDDRNGVVNSTGNPFMATGGTGDVLSGAIAALLASGLSPFDAAQIGVYLHGRAGDRVHERSRGPLLASDLACELSSSYGELYREQDAGTTTP